MSFGYDLFAGRNQKFLWKQLPQIALKSKESRQNFLYISVKIGLHKK
jgi:hypothetical protein